MKEKDTKRRGNVWSKIYLMESLCAEESLCVNERLCYLCVKEMLCETKVMCKGKFMSLMRKGNVVWNKGYV